MSKNKAGKASRYVGVAFHAGSKKYQAFVRTGGQRVHVGMWRHEIDAALARDRAVLQLKIKVLLNFPHEAMRLGPASPKELILQAKANQQAAYSSIYRGVTWNKARGRWDAVICYGYKKSQIAQFDRQEDAAVAYDRVARHLLAERAKLNFPERQLSAATIEEMREWTRVLRRKNQGKRFRGVTQDRRFGTWRAQATKNGKTQCVEGLKTAEEAAHAYDALALRNWGSKAKLNFPQEKKRKGDKR